MFLYARHVILYLVLVQPRKRPDMAENFLPTGMGGSRGGERKGVRTPPPQKKDHKKGFLSNTGLDHLKNRKATRTEFNVRPSSGRQQHAISMAFCWQADDCPLLVVF